MPEVFRSDSFSDEQLCCPHCPWKGKGSDAVIIDLYNLTAAKEVHCPRCDHKLGLIISNDDAPGESPGPLSYQIG